MCACEYGEGRIGIIDVNLTQINVEFALLGIAHDLLLYCYWAYIREEVSLKGNLAEVGNIICRALTGLCILAEVLNPDLGWLTTFTSQGDLTHDNRDH